MNDIVKRLRSGLDNVDGGELGCIKIAAKTIIEKMANPNDHKDMQDVDWQSVYTKMREAFEDDGSMPNVLAAGLMEISGHDPWEF